MKKRTRNTLAITAVTALAVVPATALAAAKKGVWIQSTPDGNQIYLQTTPKKLKVLQFSCANPAGGSTAAIVKNVKISSKGKVSKNATATLTSTYSTSKVPVTVKVSFSSKAKGTITSASCNPIKFSAKYLGKNPQG